MDKALKELAQVIEKYFGADAGYLDISCLDLAKRILDAGWEKPEWISVKDGLPKKEGDYLIYATVPFNGRKFMAVMHYEKDAYLPIWSDTTHWKPKPQPPKGE